MAAGSCRTHAALHKGRPSDTKSENVFFGAVLGTTKRWATPHARLDVAAGLLWLADPGQARVEKDVSPL